MPPRMRFGRPLRGPPLRRLFMGPPLPGRFIRPYPRFIYPLTRRLLFGSFIYLLIAGSNRPYKLHPQEVEEIERKTGKSPDSMSEEELKTSMNRLNIDNREISQEEYKKIDEMSGKALNADGIAYCSYCGEKLTKPNAKFCSNCGSQIN